MILAWPLREDEFSENSEYSDCKRTGGQKTQKQAKETMIDQVKQDLDASGMEWHQVKEGIYAKRRGWRRSRTPPERMESV